MSEHTEPEAPRTGDTYEVHSNMLWPAWSGSGTEWDGWTTEGPRFDTPEEAAAWMDDRASARRRAGDAAPIAQRWVAVKVTREVVSEVKG